MAVESVMLPLGTNAPPFELPDVSSGQIYNLESFADKSALLVMFICRHCPYVKHVENEIGKLGRDYADSGLGIVAISSNDPGHYPDDAPERRVVGRIIRDMRHRGGENRRRFRVERVRDREKQVQSLKAGVVRCRWFGSGS